MCLADIFQHMCQTGNIPQELGGTILVLIPKGNMETWVIGLLETLWKAVEAHIDTRLWSSIQFHYILHRFRYVRGMVAAIMEIELTQELASVDHNPLFLVFLDLWKAHMARDLACADSWILSVTTKTWCQDRMAITSRPSQPHGEQHRVALYLQHSSKWLCTMSSGHGWPRQWRNRGWTMILWERPSVGA